MPRFEDIPKFTRNAGYVCDHSWAYLAGHYAQEVLECSLDVNPDFQRGYVWTLDQKTRYIEYILRGGMSGRDIYFNCPGFKYGRVGRAYGPEGEYVLVDGKQRLDAVLGFMNNEVPIFGGNFYRDYTDHLDLLLARFRWHVNDLQTRAEVLAWYLDLNSGGTVHTPDELDRVKQLITNKVPYELPSQEEVIAQAGLEREVFREAANEVRTNMARRVLMQQQAPAPATAPKKKGKKS